MSIDSKWILKDCKCEDCGCAIGPNDRYFWSPDGSGNGSCVACATTLLADNPGCVRGVWRGPGDWEALKDSLKNLVVSAGLGDHGVN